MFGGVGGWSCRLVLNFRFQPCLEVLPLPADSVNHVSYCASDPAVGDERDKSDSDHDRAFPTERFFFASGLALDRFLCCLLLFVGSPGGFGGSLSRLRFRSLSVSFFGALSRRFLLAAFLISTAAGSLGIVRQQAGLPPVGSGSSVRICVGSRSAFLVFRSCC